MSEILADNLDICPDRMLVYDKEARNKTIGRKPRYSAIQEAAEIEKFIFLCYTMKS